MDLNHRPPGPEPGALARLRYAPTDLLRSNLPSQARLSDYHSFNAVGQTDVVSDAILGSTPATTCSIPPSAPERHPAAFQSSVLSLGRNKQCRRKADAFRRRLKSMFVGLERVARADLHHSRVALDLRKV